MNILRSLRDRARRMITNAAGRFGYIPHAELTDERAHSLNLAEEIARRTKYQQALRNELETFYRTRAEAADTLARGMAALQAAASIEARNAELTSQLETIANVIAVEFRDRAVHGEAVHIATIRIMRDLFRERADFEALSSNDDAG